MPKLVQWYPGHMTKARRMLEHHLSLVDVVVELVDARIPVSSRNPDIDSLLGIKPRVVALNKADLADSRATETWRRQMTGGRVSTATAIDAVRGSGVKELIDACRVAAAPRLQAEALKGRRTRAIRIMVVGVPNVGKSSLINRMAHKGSAKVGSRPGVTRGPQWVRIRDDVDLLDTPGLLWPKFDDQTVGVRLALTGAISLDVVDVNDIARELLDFLAVTDPGAVARRFPQCAALRSVPKGGVLGPDVGPAWLSDAEYEGVLTGIARSRGYVGVGGAVDLGKAADTLLRDFREGRLGRFTLDALP